MNLFLFFFLTLLVLPMHSLAQTNIAGPLTIDATNKANYENRHIVVTGGVVTINTPLNLISLTIRNGATVTHAAQLDQGLRLTIAGDLTVQTGGAINVTGLGYPAMMGPGAGRIGEPSRDRRGGGGGHGGMGGYSANHPDSGGQAYDSLTEPSEPGSGGGDYGGNVAGFGGDVIRLTVHGILRMEGGATIAANGTDSQYRAGGGAGGSIWITAQTLLGTGMISAVGAGTGGYGGGNGAGGRIAIYTGNRQFTGTIRVGNGTIHEETISTVYALDTLTLNPTSVPGGSIVVVSAQLTAPAPAGETIGFFFVDTQAVTTTVTAMITARANSTSRTQPLTIQP
jgi:hypothetical protein